MDIEQETDEQVAADVAGEILDYLSAHPMASDTLEGIAQWWLVHERYMRGLRQVERALEMLIERNLVSKHVRSDGTTLYSAGDAKPDQDGGR